MKNILIIGLLCLTFFAGQETFAQAKTVKKTTAAGETRPDVTGLMIRKFLKKTHRGGHSTYTDNLDSFRFDAVNYDPQSQEWLLYGQASDSGTGKVVTLFFRYQEWNKLLEISMTRQQNVMWKIPKNNNIKVTIPEDKSSFRLDFINNIEGIHPAGSNHNWMQGSWLLALR